jgi:hypothetical protein
MDIKQFAFEKAKLDIRHKNDTKELELRFKSSDEEKARYKAAGLNDDRTDEHGTKKVHIGRFYGPKPIFDDVNYGVVTIDQRRKPRSKASQERVSAASQAFGERIDEAMFKELIKDLDWIREDEDDVR